MQSFPVTLQQGMKKLHGHWFLAPGKLYFVCTNSNSAWGQAIGQALGGAVGGAIVGLTHKSPQALAELGDENAVQQAVDQMPGSVVITADKIKKIQCNMWWRVIKLEEGKYAFPHGLSKDLRVALRDWGQQHKVPTKL